MRRLILWSVSTTLWLAARPAPAGDLNVQGNLNVSNNLAATTITLGGQSKSNWPTSTWGATVDLGSAPMLSGSASSYSIVLTNDAAWDFGGHAAGQRFLLKIAQDTTGGYTNAWPADLRWPGNQLPAATTTASRWDVFEVYDDGTHWNAHALGLNYRDPCVTNCSHALSFDGSQWVGVPYSAAFFGHASYTVEFWFQSPTATGWHWLLGTGQGAGWMVGINGSCDVYCEWTFTGGGVSIFTPTSLCGDESWHHLAVVADAGTLTMYLDGSSIGATSYSGTLNDSATVLNLGSSDYGEPPGCGAVITLDEVRLSQTARYTGAFTPASSFTTDADTVAYWKLNEGDGATAHDETGNHTGTLHGSPAPSWVDGVPAGYTQNSAQRSAAAARPRLGTSRLSSSLVTSNPAPVTTSMTITDTLGRVWGLLPGGN